MPAFPMSAATKRITMMAGLVVACGLLSACGAPSTDVMYRAWTEGGALKSVRHDYIDGPNGAVSVPAKVSGATWSTKEDGGHAPRLEVVPTGRSVAHCLLVEGDDHVLTQRKGAPGQPVTCSAQR